MCVCVYSNSCKDVPQVAQRYRTIAAYTRHHASVLVVFVVFCLHTHSFASLIRRTPPQTFSDTAITNCHSDTTIFQLRAHWVRISWSIGSEKLFGHVPLVGVELSTPGCKASTLPARPGSPLNCLLPQGPSFIHATSKGSDKTEHIHAGKALCCLLMYLMLGPLSDKQLCHFHFCLPSK